MKVAYFSSKSDEFTSLELEREITEIQRRSYEKGSNGFEFYFFPRVSFEQFAIEMTKLRPDVLHLSLHGNTKGLWFETTDGKPVNLTAENFSNLIPKDAIPHLTILNACESSSIAKEISALGVVAVGTTSPITNRAAIASSSILYDRLINGYSIGEAVDSMAAVTNTLDDNNCSFESFGEEASKAKVLHHKINLIAKLPTTGLSIKGSRFYFDIGVAGCPATTTRVIFFTDDISFRDEKDIVGSMASISDDQMREGEIWSDSTWNTTGDFRIAACGLCSDGSTFSISDMLSKALNRYANANQAPDDYLAELSKGITLLRDNAGQGLKEWVKRRKTGNAG